MQKCTNNTKLIVVLFFEEISNNIFFYHERQNNTKLNRLYSIFMPIMRQSSRMLSSEASNGKQYKESGRHKYHY